MLKENPITLVDEDSVYYVELTSRSAVVVGSCLFLLGVVAGAFLSRLLF
jgi:hypothetical protein